MNDRIATCFSHFGAIRFKKLCDAQGWPARLSPVPRDLSSSCGTCVIYRGELPEQIPEEIEQIAERTAAGYVTLYRAEDI